MLLWRAEKRDEQSPPARAGPRETERLIALRPPIELGISNDEDPCSNERQTSEIRYLLRSLHNV